MKRKKPLPISECPYKDPLKMDEVIGCCFDPTSFIQDIASLTEEEETEQMNFLQWCVDQYGDRWDYYEMGPVLYVMERLKRI